MTHILHIDSSARSQDSVSRALTARFVNRFGGATVTRRDLAETAISHMSEDWILGAFTPEEARSEAQAQALALSDELIAELQAADTIVIGLGLYNFGLPAALKAWIDQVARAGVTFAYTEDGPQGLLAGKRAIVVAATGGTPIGSPADFATPYLKFALGFIGITDVEVVDASGVAIDAAAAQEKGNAAIDALGLAA